MDATNPFSFYKLMISPTTQSTKLSLPGSLTSAFGDCLSDSCYLTVPTGETHQVALVRKSNKLWFQDGWAEFVNRFSIGYGYFMLFTYEGKSTFRVNLFDMTACEISYGCDKAGTSSAIPNGPYDESSAESNDSRDDNNDDMMSEDSNDSISDNVEESQGTQLGIELPSWLKNYHKELEAARTAGISIPSNPFFVVFIKQYSVTRNGFLTIPRAFHDHIKCAAGDYVKVEMSPRKEWFIRYCKTNLECRLGKGWVQFALEARLNVGDVCLFELIDAENSVFKVRLARVVLD